MGKMEQTSVAEVGRWFSRFGPYVALVVVVVLVVGVAPGRDRRSDPSQVSTQAGSLSGTGTGTVGGTGTDTSTSPSGGTAPVAGTPGTPGATPGGEAVPGGGAGPGGEAEAGQVAVGPDTQPLATVAGLVANCDQATGRVKVPSKGAALCVPAFDGDNGGATTQGVSGDTIKVAVYRAQEDPTTAAIVAAAGADDSEEQVRQQYLEWVAYYESNYETYGRKVELVFVEASGAATDDAAARADALRVAELRPFASFGSPSNTYTDELVARGIMCFECAISQPADYYQERAPYVWSIGNSSTWGSIHGAEYVEKVLAGRKAEYAGTPILQQQDRKIGSLHYDTPDGDYKAAFDTFVSELTRRGLSLTAEASFYGYPDLTGLQEKVRPLIQKMKDAGVTTILLATDPFAPIFFTQEATRQQYFPEWSITGPLTDTAFFARTYDQKQMQAAFMSGGIASRLPEELSDSYRLHVWQHGKPPTAEAGYALIRIPIGIMYSGIHYAGEQLTPETFKAGLFNVPVTRGGPTRAAVSYGTRLWPGEDYTGVDDVTYIWWDFDAQGEDEIGNDGIGLYRYVDGGRRYLPGEHRTDVRWFDEAGTVLVHEDYPEGDRPPDYPSPAG